MFTEKRVTTNIVSLHILAHLNATEELLHTRPNLMIARDRFVDLNEKLIQLLRGVEARGIAAHIRHAAVALLRFVEEEEIVLHRLAEDP